MANSDPVGGDAAVLLGGATPFRGTAVGAGVGVVWAEAGPPRATSVRPNRKRELGVIIRERGKILIRSWMDVQSTGRLSKRLTPRSETYRSSNDLTTYASSLENTVFEAF